MKIPDRLQCASCKLNLPDTLPSSVPRHCMVSDIDRSTYISSQGFNDQVVNEKLKSIVARSLSEEASSKITVFGDSNLLYSISRTFSVSDSSARGKLRKYSLILTSDDQSTLLKHSNQICMFFHYLIRSLKKKRLSLTDASASLNYQSPNNTNNKNYHENYSTNTINSFNSSINDSHDPTVSIYRGSVRRDSQRARSSSKSSSASEDEDTSPPLESLRTQTIILRNLSEILDDEQIYIRVHAVAVRFLNDLYRSQ
ncbi:hypothetical protein DASC09_018960 [Saccharomycopsis crataegensis]|uniref:UDENN FLCN/SMCR8-type domain-containing protein n=1 Tax=Saccharomycopsis crataegensis TaxID=43959 RepID=A0AAV5QIR5_9ASCO|nr:hypothetical protein DASC09_018960 [Saccharomycopsis crataegensis]